MKRRNKILLILTAALYAGAAILYAALYIAGFSTFSAAEKAGRGIIFLLAAAALAGAAFLWKKVFDFQKKTAAVEEEPAGENRTGETEEYKEYKK